MTCFLVAQKQGDKHNTFGQRSKNDGLCTDGAGGTGITPGGLCGFSAAQTHTNGRAESCQTYLYTSCHCIIIFIVLVHSTNSTDVHDPIAEIFCTTGSVPLHGVRTSER